MAHPNVINPSGMWAGRIVPFSGILSLLMVTFEVDGNRVKKKEEGDDPSRPEDT